MVGGFFRPVCGVGDDFGKEISKAVFLENSTNVDLVRVGKTQERGLRRTLLKRSDCSFHGRVDRQDTESLEHILLLETLLVQVLHSVVNDIGSALHTSSSRLSALQQSPQLGREHFKYPSVRILVNEGPIKVKDDELLGHSVCERVCEWYWLSRGRLIWNEREEMYGESRRQKKKNKVVKITSRVTCKFRNEAPRDWLRPPQLN